ncbi:MAG: MazG family protein [Clostridiales bacterium]|jgi:tetrapyrrole methylase family protein/MazG family protein|nr:MazG family protein [Clostridiales bacterium]
MTNEEMNLKKQQLASKGSYDINDLLTIMKLLRAPGGCPWDRVQTHKSIRNDMLEEAYEAADAIDSDDPVHLREELGDVLLQVVFHAAISEDEDGFCFDDVVSDICAKLVLRHPHVFGEIKVDGVENVLTNWDAIKQQSHGNETLFEELDDVSRTLPSLMRAAKLSRKADKAGELPKTPGLDRYDGIAEDELEFRIGEDLFTAAAAARRRGIEPEQALYEACERFIEAKKPE